MRATLVTLATLVAGCLAQRPILSSDDSADPPGGTGNSCRSDAQCSDGALCAHNSTCIAASELRTVHVNWTVDGMPANQTACDPLGTLEIEFGTTQSVSNPQLTFSPLACAEGKFSIDKMPMTWTGVKISGRRIEAQSGTIDAATGETTLALTSRALAQ
jgi:hypothetical protein